MPILGCLNDCVMISGKVAKVSLSKGEQIVFRSAGVGVGGGAVSAGATVNVGTGAMGSLVGVMAVSLGTGDAVQAVKTKAMSGSMEITLCILFDLSAFHIKTLLVRFPHGKGFSREWTILDNGPKQRVLWHGRKVNAGMIIHSSKFMDGICAVDVIDLFYEILRKKLI